MLIQLFAIMGIWASKLLLCCFKFDSLFGMREERRKIVGKIRDIK